MYKYIALTALVLGSAALGFNINRGGEEQFTLAKVIPGTPSSPYIGGAVLSDIDQDGLDDFVKARFIDASTIVLSVRFNLGDTTVSPWSDIGEYELPDIGCTPEYMSWDTPLVVDLNGDSYPDLVCPVYVEGGEPDWCGATADLYFINNGSGGFTCAGDVTGDGQTDVDDLLGVIGDWGCVGEGLPD